MSAALVAQALVDWRSNRAFLGSSGYMLRPLGEVCGVLSVVSGRPTPAPWSRAALEWFGEDNARLHRAAMLAFPKVKVSDFERMHDLDPVRTACLSVSL